MAQPPRVKSRMRLVIIGAVTVVAALLLCVVLPASLVHNRAETHSSPPPSSSGTFDRCVVSSEAAECAAVGREILNDGGSAVDAAIAASLCGGLHHPQSAGIGGGAIMTIYDESSGHGEVIDFRETAPKFSNPDMFTRNSTLSLIGGLSVAVPGEIAGYLAAWRKYGRVSWASLFHRTVEMCERGVPLNQYTAASLVTLSSQLVTNKQFREEFFNGQQPRTVGQIVRRPRLCKTLSAIAADPDSFYNGSLADDVLADINDEGGNMTLSDLQEYSVKFRTYLRVRVEAYNFTLLVPPPPSAGVLLGLAVNILSGYGLTNQRLSGEAKDVRNTSVTLHRIVEAFKWAFAQRPYIGEAVNETLIARLTSPEWSAFVRARISDERTFNDSRHYVGVDGYQLSDGGTQHTSVVDSRGLAVSITSTINTGFGSKTLGRRTGIIFNNEMDDFATPNRTNYYRLAPSSANTIAPGRRPVSSMCPSIVIDDSGRVRLVVGAGGGPRIVTAVAWTILNHLIFNQPLLDSVNRPRLHHQFQPDVVNYEEGVEKVYRQELEKRGHVLVGYQGRLTGYVQAIARVRGQWHAVSDERKRGGVAGC